MTCELRKRGTIKYLSIRGRWARVPKLTGSGPGESRVEPEMFLRFWCERGIPELEQVGYWVPESLKRVKRGILIPKL